MELSLGRTPRLRRFRAVLAPTVVLVVTAILIAAPARAIQVNTWNGAIDTNWSALAPGSNWSLGFDPSTEADGAQNVRVTNELNGGVSQTINFNASGATIDDTPSPGHNSVLVSGFGVGKSMTVSHSLPLGLFFGFDPADHTVGILSIGGESGTGIYNQSGGFVNPVFLALGSGALGRGTYNLSAVGSDPNFPTFLPNTGLFAAEINAGLDAGAKGTIHQTGSNSRLGAQNFMTLGTAAGGEGRYWMEDGLANAFVLAVGGAGTGHVLQTGGLIKAGGVILGRDSGGQGTYDLTGGTLDQSFGGQLTVKGDPGAAGTFNLNGGAFSAFAVVNNDNFLFKKGTYDVSTTVNNANFTVGGPGAVSPLTVNVNSGLNNRGAGTLTVSGVTATFIGGVNNGLGLPGETVKVLVSHSTVTWQGDLVNHGEYRSDPSTQKFMGNLIVGSAGYLVGGTGDVFEVHKGFLNVSTRNTLWDTRNATLLFVDNIQHQLDLTGSNLGQDPAGLNNNFAWGELDLGVGAGTLFLNPFSSANGPLQPALPALYTSFFDIFVELSPNSSCVGTALECTIMDRVDGVFDIFYDNHDSRNNYLHSLTYAFGEGGSLRPIYTDAPTVPAPATLALLTVGLAGLWLGRRRRCAGA